jgi:beta-glucanase (GH16 family)
MGGLLLVLALTVVVVELPAGHNSRSPNASAQNTGLEVAAATPAPICGALGVLGQLLGACGNGSAATSCNLLGQLLHTCTTSFVPATRHDESTGAPPSATTATSLPPPTTTTTTTPVASPRVTESAGTDAPCAGTTPPIPAPSGGWACTFDDEFNGSSLDSSKWSPMTTYGSAYKTGPPLNQVCYVSSPQTISESGGYLNLSVIAAPQTYPCRGTLSTFQASYLGGMVDSFGKFSQEYGFFEARASMPPSNLPGLQETMWLYPENETLYGPWPDSGEIDFAEFYSKYPNNDIPAVLYPGSGNDPNAQSDKCVIAGQTPNGQFHTYALMWTPTTMTTYYDGTPCMTDVYAPYVNNPDTAPAPFNQPFFLNFTAALGWNNGNVFRSGETTLPATMQVDWVRVWQYGQ